MDSKLIFAHDNLNLVVTDYSCVLRRILRLQLG